MRDNRSRHRSSPPGPCIVSFPSSRALQIEWPLAYAFNSCMLYFHSKSSIFHRYSLQNSCCIAESNATRRAPLTLHSHFLGNRRLRGDHGYRFSSRRITFLTIAAAKNERERKNEEDSDDDLDEDEWLEDDDPPDTDETGRRRVSRTRPNGTGGRFRSLNDVFYGAMGSSKEEKNGSDNKRRSWLSKRRRKETDDGDFRLGGEPVESEGLFDEDFLSMDGDDDDPDQLVDMVSLEDASVMDLQGFRRYVERMNKRFGKLDTTTDDVEWLWKRWQRRKASRNRVVKEQARGSAAASGWGAALRNYFFDRQTGGTGGSDQAAEYVRIAREQTVIAIRFILLLILLPSLVQAITKSVLVGPLVDLRQTQVQTIFLNETMEEKAFAELQRFEERLHFEMLVGKLPPLDDVLLEQRLKEKAHELAEHYRDESANSVKNVIADCFGAAALIIYVTRAKREITVFKSFLDKLLTGMSDTVKSFMILLLSDMMVGFHSPHGWEIVLEAVARHFGLPEDRDFIFLFIATFPVVLDVMLKYWIFNYINRVSPSSVATYRSMNDG